MRKAELSKALDLLRRGDWEAAHKIVQEDEESPLACWAHGIVHLMEGDASNARHWYREAKREFPRNPSIAEEIAALGEVLGARLSTTPRRSHRVQSKEHRKRDPSG